MMKARKRQNTSLPTMIPELMLVSLETVTQRALLIAENKCSPAEYARMLSEKAEAAAATGLTLISSGGRATAVSMLAPWYRRAVANARRLRKE
jgi:hypothetical protein